MDKQSQNSLNTVLCIAQNRLEVFVNSPKTCGTYENCKWPGYNVLTMSRLQHGFFEVMHRFAKTAYVQLRFQAVICLVLRKNR